MTPSARAAAARKAYPPRLVANWTPERIALSTLMWTQGDSATAVSAALNAGLEQGEYRFTRNSVIGLMRRRKVMTGNPAKRATRATIRRPRRRRALSVRGIQAAREKLVKAKALMIGPTIQSQPLPAEPRIAAEPLMLSLLDLRDDTCKWPMGDPRVSGFGFCGHLTVDGKPYCAEHVMRAYQPVPPRKMRPRGYWQ